MTNRQENKANMIKTVITTLLGRANASGIIPAIVNAISDLKAKYDEILGKDREKGTTTSGKTKVKNQASANLIEHTMKVAGPLTAFGYTNNKPEVTSIAGVSRNTLKHMRETDLGQKAEDIYTIAQAQLDQLTDYGITGDVLDELRARIDTYKAAMGDQDSSMANRVSAGVSLATLFQEADMILKLRLDPLMEGLKGVNPEFYNAYKAARVIKDLRGSGKRQKSVEEAEAIVS